MCVGCEVTNAAGGVSTVTALVASSFPVAGIFVMKFFKLFSLHQLSQKSGHYWKLGLLLAGYQFTVSLILGILGLALTKTNLGKLLISTGVLLFILLWIWFSWTIAKLAKHWLMHHSFILAGLGLVPLLLLYNTPGWLLNLKFNHQFSVLMPILPEFALLNLCTALLSVIVIPTLIGIFQRLLIGKSKKPISIK